MRKINRYVILLTLILLIFTAFIGCSSKNNSDNTFGVEQFANEMKAKNYKFKLEDVEEDFLPTTRKRMIIDKDSIEIYLYNSNREAEKDAKRIDDGGCGYNNGDKSIKIHWSSYPHFYKKGSIIVQYVGENEKILSDLNDIFGQQFAGYK